MKTISMMLILIAMLSCSSKDESMFYYLPEPVVNLRIVDGKFKILGRDYDSAYGLSKETSVIPLKKVYNVDQYLGSNEFDSVFMLPINLNSDTSVFCLQRKDLSVDTICFKYLVKASIYSRIYQIYLDDLAVKWTSLSLSNDSFEFNQRSRYYLKIHKR